MLVEQVPGQSTNNSSHNSIGTTLELLDDYEDETELRLTTPISDPVQLYPSQTHCPSRHLVIILDTRQDVFLKDGSIVTVIII